jgi:hypothetical protein
VRRCVLEQLLQLQANNKLQLVGTGTEKLLAVKASPKANHMACGRKARYEFGTNTVDLAPDGVSGHGAFSQPFGNQCTHAQQSLLWHEPISSWIRFRTGGVHLQVSAVHGKVRCASNNATRQHGLELASRL